TVIALFAVSSACLGQTQPTFRSTSNIVSVPTLVRYKSGATVTGLSERDFIVEDNGIPQRIHVDERPEVEPISIVVAVQRGRDAVLQFENSNSAPQGGAPSRVHSTAPMSGLGTMLEFYIGGTKAEVAVVTFDSQVRLLQDFTEDLPTVQNKLKGLN